MVGVFAALGSVNRCQWPGTTKRIYSAALSGFDRVWLQDEATKTNLLDFESLAGSSFPDGAFSLLPVQCSHV